MYDATTQLRSALDQNDQGLMEQCVESLNDHYGQMDLKTAYPHLLYLHTVLFGGELYKIDRDVGTLCKSNDLKSKYDYLASSMRESLTQATPENHVISRLYDMIGFYESNDNNIWTALFAVAAEEKQAYKRVQDFEKTLLDFFNDSSAAIEEEDVEKLEEIQAREEQLLTSMTDEEIYQFHIGIIALQTKQTRDDVDQIIAREAGTNDPERKRQFLTDKTNDPYGSLDLTPVNERRLERQATHLSPRTLQ